jgi:hypothetical protein
MKRNILMAVIAALLTTFSFMTMKAIIQAPTVTEKTDSDGHVLVSLWKDYKSAVDSDRPKKEAEILSKIKSEAKSKKLAWDFYDAARNYVNVVSNRDWKMRDSLDRQYAAEIQDFDYPIVTFSFLRDQGKSDSLYKYVSGKKHLMLKEKNIAFYDKNFAEYYSNDYEYALWKILPFKNGKLATFPAYKELAQYLDGSYPNGAYLEYYVASTEGKDYDLQVVADKYKGKAIALLPRQDLLSNMFDMLQKAKAKSDDYKAFLKECESFNKDRDAFSGSEAKIAKRCTKVDGIISTLKSKRMEAFMRGDTVKVALCNMDAVTINVYKSDRGNVSQNKVFYSREIKNEKLSFFAQDTVSMKLPNFDDGQYWIEAKSHSDRTGCNYSKYSLSIAQRLDSKGLGIYLADDKTGKPIEKATLKLFKGDKLVGTEPDFSFNGFTKLPSSFEAIVESHENVYYEMTCSFKDENGRLTSSKSLGMRYFKNEIETESRQDDYGMAFIDRGAYNPGDTVHFKGIFYKGNLVKALKTYPAGEKVTAELYSNSDDKIASINLNTNDFGSVAGDFVLPKDLKNGIFSIRLNSGQNSCECYLRVDEFVLPTFDLSFTPSDKLYLPGDTVNVEGKVTSYSGHSLSEAKASYKVMSNVNGKVVSEGKLPLKADGSFSLEFASDNSKSYRYSSYKVEVTIFDATGETHNYFKVIYVIYHLSLDAKLVNGSAGNFQIIGNKSISHSRNYWSDNGIDDKSENYILEGDNARFSFAVNNTDGKVVKMPVSYILKDEKGKALLSGNADSGSDKVLDLSVYPSGVYKLYAKASIKDRSGKDIESRVICQIFKVSSSDKVLDAPLNYYFKPSAEQVESGSDFKVDFGSASGPVWAIAELYGKNRTLLDSRLIHLDGERGKSGSMTSLSYKYRAEYPDDVFFQIFYFKNSESVSYGYHFHRARPTLDMPLSFSSFADKTYPATKYSFTINTLPNAECLAAVFDKSTETIRPNDWNTVSLSEFRVEDVNIEAVCGGTEEFDLYFNENITVVGYGASPRRLFGARAKSANMMLLSDSAVEATANDEEVVETPTTMSAMIRDNFANTLTFQPFLHSDKNGNIEFSFSTSDKLSTYYVALFAHTKDMKNATLRKEMLVTIPVKVSVVEPKYLYQGDKYSLSATVSSNSDKPISGILSTYIYNGRDYKNLKPVSVKSEKITIPAGGVSSAIFEVPVPSPVKGSAASFAPAPDSIGLMTTFVADKVSGGSKVSDGMFVAVPVLKNLQTITEAHSGVLLPGMDKDSLAKALEKEFVNVSAAGAEYSEVSILDMVKAVIPTKVNPDGKDVLSLSEAYYVRLLAAKLGAQVEEGEIPTSELLAKILACRNGDGGFGWFEGMHSSPMITAVMMERIAKIRDAGLADAASFGDMKATVKYLDDSQFGVNLPYWCGWVSTDQYLYVRSLYPSVAFNVKASGDVKVFNKNMADFRKYVRSYLVPGKVRGLNGYILGKARRVLTLENLTASAAGVDLANAWGVRLAADSRMRKSIEADVVSLKEYAVDHKDGGMYFPNAVMPWRGLLESEAYAHSILCDLLEKYGTDGRRISDGIRIWLMLQKETQKWDQTPDFLDAVNSIMAGSDEVKSTRVIRLVKSFEKPFDEIAAAGNGFTIERKFYREVTQPGSASGVPSSDGASESVSPSAGQVTMVEIKPGEMLHKGDKIIAKYNIWNAENRSFVKLTAPREACLRPVEQLSGYYGWWLRPLMVNGFYSVSPQGYRNVKAAVTEYYFDTYPEEKTTVTEEFFATQTGIFTAPVVTIESLYATHYRANDKFFGKLLVE